MMGYVDGYVIAVPETNRQAFIDHANTADPIFMELGATRILECWQEDVPNGTITDFFGAVEAKDDERVVFSWVEWPDRATRDAAVERFRDGTLMDDPRMNPETNPMPFDGKRMIFGGFEPIFDEGQAASGGYVQGFVIPVPAANREAYRKMAADAWDMFRDYGALRLVEAWGDDVLEGKVTDFRRAAKAEPEEAIVFAYMEWPSRGICDASHEKMKQDERMTMPEGTEMPFDGKRMIFGGFMPVVELGK